MARAAPAEIKKPGSGNCRARIKKSQFLHPAGISSERTVAKNLHREILRLRPLDTGYMRCLARPI